MTNDDGLATRLADDLDGSFGALVVGHTDRLYSVALRLLDDPRDAEEVVSDTFLRAHRAIASYEATRTRDLRLRPWLTTILVRLCRNRRRRRAARIVQLEPLAGSPAEPRAGAAQGPEAVVARSVESAHWARLLRDLPDRYRVAVVLRHVDELSYEEIAAALGRPTGTIKARVHRGLSLLRAAHEAALREELSA